RRIMLDAIRFLTIVPILIAVPASAETVAYEFTGAAADGATARGTFWFDTSRVLQSIPHTLPNGAIIGTEWTFLRGGLGVGVGSIGIQNPDSSSGDLFCNTYNTRDL